MAVLDRVEVFLTPLGRQTAHDAQPVVETAPSIGQHALGQIRGQDADRRGLGRKARLPLGDHHRDAVGLLTAGAGGRPDADGFLARLQFRQQDLAQDLEWIAVAKPGGLVGGHGIDDARLERRIGRLAQRPQQILDLAVAELAEQTRQPAGDEILTILAQHQAAALRKEPSELGVILRVNHERTPYQS